MANAEMSHAEAHMRALVMRNLVQANYHLEKMRELFCASCISQLPPDDPVAAKCKQLRRVLFADAVQGATGGDGRLFALLNLAAEVVQGINNPLTGKD